jgi:hypothetical protein
MACTGAADCSRLTGYSSLIFVKEGLPTNRELTDSWLHFCHTTTKISGPHAQFVVVSWPEDDHLRQIEK